MIFKEPIAFKSLIDRGLEEQQPYLIVTAYDLEQELWLGALAGEGDSEIAFMFAGEAGMERVKRMAELMQEANGGVTESSDSEDTGGTGKS